MSGWNDIETDMVTPIRGTYEGRCRSENKEDGMSGYIETDMVTPIRGTYEGRCRSENMEDGMSGYIETDMVTPIRGKYMVTQLDVGRVRTWKME